jgi:hypothetical protein
MDAVVCLQQPPPKTACYCTQRGCKRLSYWKLVGQVLFLVYLRFTKRCIFYLPTVLVPLIDEFLFFTFRSHKQLNKTAHNAHKCKFTSETIKNLAANRVFFVNKLVYNQTNAKKTKQQVPLGKRQEAWKTTRGTYSLSNSRAAHMHTTFFKHMRTSTICLRLSQHAIICWTHSFVWQQSCSGPCDEANRGLATCVLQAWSLKPDVHVAKV